MNTQQNKIENQNKVIALLDNYGAEFTSKGISVNSEMAYAKSNGGGQIMLIVSADVDMSDVLYGVNIEGVKSIKCTQMGLPVNRITFN